MKPAANPVNLTMAAPEKKGKNSTTPLKKIVAKKLNMKKLSGKLSWKGDPTLMQRQLRAHDR